MSINAKIEGDEIVIRIPIEALPHAAEVAWDQEYGEDEHALYVEDVNEFAKEFVYALLKEDEEGSTVLHFAFGEAVIEATEQGACGINDRNNPN